MITSRTRVCAPNPKARLANPARVTAGVMLIWNSPSAVRIATAQTILLPAPYRTPASVRVCCSRSCAERPGAQARGQRPKNPQTPKEDDPNPPRIDPKLVLEENQKEIKKSVEKLYDLASELKAEVEKTDSVHVLSVAMLRKTDEIEKLAKEIRSRAKG